MKNSRFGTAGLSMSATQNGYYAKAWQRATKLLMIMKLVIVLLTVACLQVSAKGSAQTVTLSAEKMALPDLFKAIEKQTGFLIAYHSSVTDEAPLMTVHFQGTPLKEALDACTKIYPFQYVFIDKNIIISKNETKSSTDEHRKDSTRFKKISGKVITKQGEPLAGANIVLKRTGAGTITDAKGIFSFSDVVDEDILVVTFIGYQTQSVKIGDISVITITTDVTTDPLDKIVVQGYGITSDRLRVGNIGKITSEDIQRQPVGNVIETLQGQIAGLSITHVSGYSTAPLKVEIRGRTAINPDIPSEPLYIIDGVPLTILDVTANANYNTGSLGFTQAAFFMSPAAGQSPFFSLNPSDIESIEVLKDADATAIYGSRGANGVILITTKRGKMENAKLEVNANQGISQITRFYEMMDTKEYVQARKTAFANDGIVPDEGNAADIVSWDTSRYTNWQKALWGNKGKRSVIEASLSGGSKGTSFRISGSFLHQTDILAKSGADTRGNLLFNLNYATLNQKFKISTTSTYSFAKNRMIYVPSTTTLAPNAPAIYALDGSLNYIGWRPLNDIYPFGSLLRSYQANTRFFNTSIKNSYEVITGLEVKLNLGYNLSLNEQAATTPIASKDPSYNQTGELRNGISKVENVIVEPQIDYNVYLNRGKINVLVGSSIQRNTTEGTTIMATGYTTDQLIRSINSAPNRTAYSSFGEYKYAALFGRVNYTLSEKYIVNVNWRRDGSSRFGPGRRFGNFGALGAAWIFGDEKFLKENVKFLSFGKLRGSIGTTGNDRIGDYQYLNIWSYSPFTYNGRTLLSLTRHYDSLLQWEVNKKMELGINVTFLNNSISLEASWYRNLCSNQLVYFPTPGSTGFRSVLSNSPAKVQNKGIEVVLETKNFVGSFFKWSTRLNIAWNRNKLLDYPNISQSPYASMYSIGHPLSIRYLLRYTGVDPQTGLYTFKDLNNDGNITVNYTKPVVNDDRYIFNTTPKYEGGLSNVFDIGNFQLSVLLYFKKQVGTNLFSTANGPGSVMENSPKIATNYWRKPGDVTRFAKPTTDPYSNESYLNYSLSDNIFSDASFIRLQNISLSYTIPKKILTKVKLSNWRFYVQAQNLSVFTSYEGVDPEVQSFGALPIPAVITGGMSISL